METTEEENIHNAVNKALTEFSEKLKEEYRLHGFKTKEFFEVIDKTMGSFNHNSHPLDENVRLCREAIEDNNIKGLKVIDGTPTAISNYLSEREKDNNIKGCGKTFKQKSNLSEYTARCGQLICPEVELCPKCQEKYTKKYSKRNGIHQVGLKEDKRR